MPGSENAPVAWTYLLTAGLTEVIATTLFRYTEGFTRLGPSLCFGLAVAISMYCLQKSLAGIPLGTAYAVWTGIGAAGTAVLGMMMFAEPVTLVRSLLLVLLIGSVIGLKLAGQT